MIDGRSWWRLGLPVALVASTLPLLAQAPAGLPPDLFVTRLQGDRGAPPAPSAPQQRPVELPPLPLTLLDERLQTADLDGPRRISLTVSRPMPLRDLLLLLVNGTPMSLVNDEAVDGNFVGDLKDLTMRQALEAVLFPRGLDYDVQGTLVRVFPRKASTRLFTVDYLNMRRTSQREVRSTASVDARQTPSAELSATVETDLFDELGKGVEALLSASGRMHMDRAAGLVQVTDFADRLDRVGVYVEAVQLRATRQVRIEAHVFDVTFPSGSAAAIDWNAVALRTSGAPRTTGGRGAAGLTVTDVASLKQAIAEQGSITMIASPRIVATNNEPAVMRVGTQSVFVESSSAPEERSQRTSRVASVLEGLTLSVTAQIASDGIVQLHVAPTYASRAGQVKSHAGDTFPVLRISEADTIVRVRDGETIVLSGFLEDREAEKPAPGLAAMFGGASRTIVKSELVILLTPTVVSPGIHIAAAAR